MDAIVDIFCWSMRVLSGGVVAIGAARPAVAGHRQSAGCSWSQEAGFGVLGLGAKPCSASKGGRPRKFAGGAKPPAVTFFGPAGRDWKFVCRAGRRTRWYTRCCQFLVCVSALVCLCVCSSVLRVHVQLCVVSPAGPGPFRAQSRSGGIAKLWIRIKLHHETFHTQSWLQSLTWEMIPRRPDASQAACEGCGDPPLGALRFRTGDGLPQAPAVSSQPHSPWTLRAAVRLVHHHVCGAVRQCCVRQVLSPILQLLQGFVQGCLQRQLVGAGAEDAQWSRRCARCSLSCSATRANSGPTRTRASWAWFGPWRTRAVDRRRLRQFLSVCWTHIARTRVDGRL